MLELSPQMRLGNVSFLVIPSYSVMPDETQFKDIQIGQKFNHAGTTYTKTRASHA